MYSRIERGDRQAKKEQVVLLSDILNIEREELLSLWIADKINAIIDSVPAISDVDKQFFKESIKIRKELIIDKALENI